MRLLLATRSDHKAEEIRRMLAAVPALELVSPDDVGMPESPEEEGLEPHATFEANARSKARWFQRRGGLPALADDSGIEVDALHGAPGVRSKRFAPLPPGVAGEERDRANNAWLLERLRGVPPERRTARYVCVAVLDVGGGEARVFRGEAPGLILSGPRGHGGFGYDPLFLDPALGRTFAEITGEEKDARSHRGRAVRSLAAHL